MHTTTLLTTYVSWILSRGYHEPKKVIWVSPNIKSAKMTKRMIELSLNKASNNKLEIDGNSTNIIVKTNNNQLTCYSSRSSICGEMADIIIFDEYVDDAMEKFAPLLKNKPDTKIIINSSIYDSFNKIWVGYNSFQKFRLHYSENILWTEERLENRKKVIGDSFNKEMELIMNSESKSKNKNNIIQVRLDDEIMLQIGLVLIKEDITISEYIRGIIKNDLDGR